MWRILFYVLALLSLSLTLLLKTHVLFSIILVLTAIGLYDIFFSQNNVLINYPIVGHLRYCAEMIRPEIQQYFIASNLSDTPFNREQRELVYQRAMGQDDHLPFGTQRLITESGYDFAMHSLAPKVAPDKCLRTIVGQGKNAYSASRLNVSGMSFGALSATAIQSLNLAAQLGQFAHNTGEGGISDHHLQGGDLIWQIGTAYFGCRSKSGSFCPEAFKENAARPQVKMIEIKLSQGAKPSHGGILPLEKITPEIATIRNIHPVQDCISPPYHEKAKTPLELVTFIQELRLLSEGKPIGFKLCLSHPQELMSIFKAMIKSNIFPDFITLDGAEGGTGAAPLEFSNRLGMPLTNALILVHSIAIAVGIREKFKIIASGKIITGFDILHKLALGADLVNSARAMMFALGCIQSLRCHTNSCPTGVATQDPKRAKAINPEIKKNHVAQFHRQTLRHYQELLGALGYTSAEQLSPKDILRMMPDGSVKHYCALYPLLEYGAFLKDHCNHPLFQLWQQASVESFK